MKNLILLTIATVALAGCAVKQKVMDVSMVSMTHAYIPEGQKLVETGPVTGKFCLKSSDRGNIGLFDETVKSAQEQHKVDFISNVSFWSEAEFMGPVCTSLEGTGEKLVATNAVATSPEKLTPTTKLVPAKKNGK